MQHMVVDGELLPEQRHHSSHSHHILRLQSEDDEEAIEQALQGRGVLRARSYLDNPPPPATAVMQRDLKYDLLVSQCAATDMELCGT